MLFRSIGVEDGNVTSANPSGEPVEASIWHFNRETDPISGDSLKHASAEFHDGVYSLQLKATCINDIDFKYDLSVYEDDKGAAIKRINLLSPIFNYTIRLDAAKPETWTMMTPSYSNTVTIVDENNIFTRPDGSKYNSDVVFGGNSPDKSLLASRMHKAQHIVLRFPLYDGEATFEVDQTDESFRAVTDSCSIKTGYVPPAVSNVPSAPATPAPKTPEQAPPVDSGENVISEGL